MSAASRNLFEDDLDSDLSGESVSYFSSDESEGVSDGWDSDCSTDRERLIERMERDVHASPMLIGGRIMTVEEDETVQGPSTSRPNGNITPELGSEYFNEELCFAPKKENALQRIQLCKTTLPVAETLLSPPPHERGTSNETPLIPQASGIFKASFHIQNSRPHDNLSMQRCTSCMVCGGIIDEIKDEKVRWYMERSTARGEPEYIKKLRREAYINGINEGVYFLYHPQCRRLPPVMASTIRLRLLIKISRPKLCLFIRTRTSKTTKTIYLSSWEHVESLLLQL